MGRTRRIVRVGEVADGVLGKADPQGRRFSARVVAAWHDVCGSVVGGHTKGVAFHDGELVVSVDSPAWATELSVLSDTFRSALATHLGQDLVRSIRFTVSKRVQIERQRESAEQDVEEFYRPDEVAPVRLSEVEREQAAYVSRAVPDEKLREIALRVMVKDLEWKKAVRERSSAQAPPGGVSGHELTA